MEDLSGLSNEDIREGLKNISQNERAEVVRILNFLSEAGQRNLHAIDGYADLITFARVEYKYTGGVAWHRVKAASVLKAISID